MRRSAVVFGAMVTALLGVRCVSTSDLSSSPGETPDGGGGGEASAETGAADAAGDAEYHGNGEIIVTANGVQSMTGSADTLYWSNFAPKSIRSVPFAGPYSSPTEVATPVKGSSIAYGRMLFWSEVAGVAYIGPSGPGVAQMPYGAIAVAADDEAVYAIDLGSDVYVLQGDPPTGASKLAVGSGAKRLAVHHGLAWADAGAVYLCANPATCDATTDLVASEAAHGLALDDARVYWSLADGRIRARARDLTTAAFDVATGLPTPAELAADPTSENLYFTAYGTGERSFLDGIVGKVSKAGGTPVVIAHDQARPDALVLSSTEVFWSDTLDATIRKLPK